MGLLKLEDLTPSQRNIICNGCGPANWGWVSRLIPQFCFKEAGDAHDLAYWEGGGLLDKFGADLQFLIDCLSSTLKQQKRWWPTYAIWSFIFFSAVVLGGRRSFRWAKPRTKEDLEAIL
jgi:hypothetical protein